MRHPAADRARRCWRRRGSRHDGHPAADPSRPRRDQPAARHVGHGPRTGASTSTSARSSSARASSPRCTRSRPTPWRCRSTGCGCVRPRTYGPDQGTTAGSLSVLPVDAGPAVRRRGGPPAGRPAGRRPRTAYLGPGERRLDPDTDLTTVDVDPRGRELGGRHRRTPARHPRQGARAAAVPQPTSDRRVCSTAGSCARPRRPPRCPRCPPCPTAGLRGSRWCATARSSGWSVPARTRSTERSSRWRRRPPGTSATRSPTRTTSRRTSARRRASARGDHRRRPRRADAYRVVLQALPRPRLDRAELRDGAVERRRCAVHVWSHSQGIHALRDAIAAALGAGPVAESSVEHVENAGCYGHNAADDAAFDAVLLARAVPGRPVLLRWSRRDELTWGPLSPGDDRRPSRPRLVDGRIEGWSLRRVEPGPHLAARVRRQPGLLGDGPPRRRRCPAARGRPARCRRAAARPQRDAALRRRPAPGHRAPADRQRRCAPRRCVRSAPTSTSSRSSASWTSWPPTPGSTRSTSGSPTWPTRGPGPSSSCAARASGWGEPLADVVGRGIGFARYKGNGAWCAVVAEVEVETDVRVRRLTVAADLGLVINPDGARNQLTGGAVQATSWTTKERVRFDRRRVTSEDWESYPILRFPEVAAGRGTPRRQRPAAARRR